MALFQYLFQNPDHFIHMLLFDYQRWDQSEYVGTGFSEEKSFLVTFFHVNSGFFRELYADHEVYSTNFVDEDAGFGQTVQPIVHVAPDFSGIVDEPVVNQFGEHRKAGCRGKGIAAEGGRVISRLKNGSPLGSEQGTYWNTSAKSFCEGDSVGVYPVILMRKKCSRSAETALDFVKYQQGFVSSQSFLTS